MWIYTKTQATHQISFDRAAALLFEYLTTEKKLPNHTVAQNLIKDITCQKGRAIPAYLKAFTQPNYV